MRARRTVEKCKKEDKENNWKNWNHIFDSCFKIQFFRRRAADQLEVFSPLLRSSANCGLLLIAVRKSFVRNKIDWKFRGNFKILEKFFLLSLCRENNFWIIIMREIVHLQAGQCGNQIGAKVRQIISGTSIHSTWSRRWRPPFYFFL